MGFSFSQEPCNCISLLQRFGPFYTQLSTSLHQYALKFRLILGARATSLAAREAAWEGEKFVELSHQPPPQGCWMQAGTHLKAFAACTEALGQLLLMPKDKMLRIGGRWGWGWSPWLLACFALRRW